MAPPGCHSSRWRPYSRGGQARTQGWPQPASQAGPPSVPRSWEQPVTLKNVNLCTYLYYLGKRSVFTQLPSRLEGQSDKALKMKEGASAGVPRLDASSSCG
jgi:hypothetical protein